MARARVPVAVAAASGAAAKNPGRHAGRKAKGGAGLGGPSAHLTVFAKRAFERFRAELPWLKEQHRVLVELASIYRGRMLDPEDRLPMDGAQELRRCLAQLGATPADESRVAGVGGDDEDPDDALFAHPGKPLSRAH